MKNKIFSMVALIVSAIAFFVSIAFLVYRISNDLSFHAIIFQIIATGLITVLCFFNVIYLFTSPESSNDDSDE